MSSISGGSFASNFQSGGIQMGGTGGNLPEGSGSFYMGGDEPGQEQQNQQNPELVIVDQAEVDRKSQNRQYLETVILGRERSWFDPWSISAPDNLRIRGREDLTGKSPNGRPRQKKQLFVNA
jgi:hypothetical protein